MDSTRKSYENMEEKIDGKKKNLKYNKKIEIEINRNSFVLRVVVRKLKRFDFFISILLYCIFIFSR